MNEGKLIDGNMSSIIDLKAELYRKQEAFRLKKLSSTQRQLVEDNDNLYANTNQTKYKLGKRIRQKNDHELRQQRLQTSVTAKGRVTELSEELAEEEKALKRSREMLEMKSRLYEKWTQNPDLLNANKDDEDLDEDIDDRILVDFHRKAYEDVRTKSDSKSEPMIENNDKETEEEEEEWTEFVDSLGRSRKCLKKDLQHFVDIDRQSFQRNTTVDKSDIPSVPELSPSNELLSDDLRREIERRNWETGARNELTGETDGPQRDNLNVHYQSVKRNEIRDHGVAYYAFSEDQQMRQQQMDLLNQMREQTKTQKQQKQNLKQKRKQLLRQRLAKVAQRKGIALEVKESSGDSDDEVDESEPMAAPEPRPVPSSVREWDVGKEDLPQVLADMTPKRKPNLYNNYIEDRRDERNADFAPPSSYDSRKQLRNNSSDRQRTPFVRETPKLDINSQKPIDISHNCDEMMDNNKCSVNCDSNTSANREDVSQMISSALSYFRNNLQK